MIEIKISQGAKPSHGGVLPADKITEEHGYGANKQTPDGFPQAQQDNDLELRAMDSTRKLIDPAPINPQ